MRCCGRGRPSQRLCFLLRTAHTSGRGEGRGLNAEGTETHELLGGGADALVARLDGARLLLLDDEVVLLDGDLGDGRLALVEARVGRGRGRGRLDGAGERDLVLAAALAGLGRLLWGGGGDREAGDTARDRGGGGVGLCDACA